MPVYEFSTLRVEQKGSVATVWLAHPPVNAVNTTLIQELTLALDMFGEDPEVRCVILTGEGRIFCAGADLKGRSKMLAEPGGLPQHSRRTRELFHAIRECPKPVIAALNGPALGAGLGIAASCDILIAADTACLALPEVDVGLLGGVKHAQRLFGHSRLRRMMLTGLRVSAQELYRLGIVEACVPGAELLAAAGDMAQQIASKSPTSVQLMIQTANAIEDMSLRDGYRYEQDMTAQVAKTEDAQEARRAFLEKRPPVFTDR
ncbi:enoyl-CoA hydratase/isomerase family protein [Bordetella holmesii]|uniref:Enoyl-CoA hydratase/isomerase family protein n=1 Tax=Bordetella holmesii CDC-H585-BH TaxID=1331206 RepID=A0A158M091_9BORD|nr:enoyl-CoA hydratase/isomerase family protein [Bordetella holmesii]AHV94476.1 enoyl-CoA hydratase/isomerase family protein [Bordetella holmesii ATCC 51541]AIT25234.1 enoyl-CoA hydratase/isomerase family protein [Bordetella holmesii 44057]EWM45798.1 enoyl-CoA hydratase/isomerase family protein [Bordetella holmesii 70147]EWM48241.1 enoyl-CoA hydratase/isomerase family protein [Bordetella holmesii 41130]AMD44455.1 enoyl-CoA hydratase [Bordetella holmesii H558]